MYCYLRFISSVNATRNKTPKTKSGALVQTEVFVPFEWHCFTEEVHLISHRWEIIPAGRLQVSKRTLSSRCFVFGSHRAGTGFVIL